MYASLPLALLTQAIPKGDTRTREKKPGGWGEGKGTATSVTPDSERTVVKGEARSDREEY